MSAFTRGFSNVLDLYAETEDEKLVFEYKGRNLESTTTEEALASDWSSLISTVVETSSGDERVVETGRHDETVVHAKR
jgi:hypothetical protein